ncbi:hypothetical protein SLEP1_g52403 [Rubroshorea leprosula]|uniref:Secreted protein n=1 Tax=Rubroshorea leprosula TaxID=152421 RepID=A0AAV5M718_9ROSI|nr:hypothetical protein SLEP1_g52403 [Rubroshorea leprosula]
MRLLCCIFRSAALRCCSSSVSKCRGLRPVQRKVGFRFLLPYVFFLGMSFHRERVQSREEWPA